MLSYTKGFLVYRAIINLLIGLSFGLLVCSCSAEKTSFSELKNGRYQADVSYYNPKTNNKNTYELEVTIKDSQLTKIHFPNTGMLDETQFTAEDINSGSCKITTVNGVIYHVKLR